MRYLFLVFLLLAGCKQEEKKVAKPVQSISKSFFKVKELPKPEPVIEQAPPEAPPRLTIPPVQFPDSKPLMREIQARQMRGKRLALQSRPKPQPADKITVHLEDESYQVYEGSSFEPDITTLKVDRTRILTADMRIPAILEDSLNSQLAGRFIAIIDKDILSPNCKKVLLPAYSKIICYYEGVEDVNSTRLGATCKRIIRPDGMSVALTDSNVADRVGRNGLIGDLDHRTLERYGAAFTVSLISALAQASSQISDQQTFNNAATQLSNNLGQVTSKVLEQKLDLRPIITVPAGSRIHIIPNQDIYFRKPRLKRAAKK
jgi:type IV secretion system protein VirB10